ncbi:MAG TPA: pyridine nucleotide-disulfide oxidoreductase [Clostridiales bacterium]|nr:pyridine nucleotide-disulfide oxidoreductase [Clostridiales bacterium]
MSKKIVIVGAGYAGIETALRLNKLNKLKEVEITVIDKNSYHTLLTELHEVAGNRVSEEAVRIPLNRIFKYTDINIVCDKITKYDYENNVVKSDTKDYAYDYLVLAIGSSPNFFNIKGLEENAFTLWSFDDAIRIREHIKDCFVKASTEEDPEKRKQLLTFAISGAGFTGVEMMGELAQWVKSLVKEHRIDRSEVRLIIVDMLPRILNNLGEENAKKAHEYMEKKLNVEVRLNTAVKEVTADGFSTGNEFIKTKTLIWAAGVRANNDVDEMQLGKPCRANRVKVDQYCRTDYKNVYAIGDVSGLICPIDDREYPAMVENALQTGHGVAKNIFNDINSKEQETVEVKMHGIMVSIGNYFTVSEIMGKKLPVWLSIIMKYLVNMHYLFGITGFAGVARYLYHEVLERRQRKHFFEQHWSRRMQAWWVVPVRVFLGLTWLIEGIKKVKEGWFTSPKLASFLGMATDGIAGATPGTALAKRIDEVFGLKLHIFNFFIGKETSLLEGEALSSTLFTKIELFHFGDFNLVPWFLKNIVLAGDGIAMFFQVLTVIFEIGVGLLLIGGAFTFLASVVSAGLLAMFVTSTGLYESTWWMAFASIATMGGAGRAFGLDYYLIPYLCNVWDNFSKNGKLRLFFKRSFDRYNDD